MECRDEVVETTEFSDNVRILEELSCEGCCSSSSSFFSREVKSTPDCCSSVYFPFATMWPWQAHKIILRMFCKPNICVLTWQIYSNISINFFFLTTLTFVGSQAPNSAAYWRGRVYPWLGCQLIAGPGLSIPLKVYSHFPCYLPSFVSNLCHLGLEPKTFSFPTQDPRLSYCLRF